jgi:hypothetical protein
LYLRDRSGGLFTVDGKADTSNDKLENPLAIIISSPLPINPGCSTDAAIVQNVTKKENHYLARYVQQVLLVAEPRNTLVDHANVVEVTFQEKVNWQIS